MGHIISSTFFAIIIIGLLLRKTKLKDKVNLTKVHTILGSIFIVYMTIYSIIDYSLDKEPFILLLLPSLIGIGYTGKNKHKIKFKYAHTAFVCIFLISLLLHVLV